MAGDHQVVGTDRLTQASQFSSNLAEMGSGRCVEHGDLKAARHGVLADLLKPGHRAIGSINSPMQCMMKEICAQCLQAHRDPESGLEFVVFSCFNQDQPLPGLAARLRQNSVQEKLTAQWIDHCLRGMDKRG